MGTIRLSKKEVLKHFPTQEKILRTRMKKGNVVKDESLVKFIFSYNQFIGLYSFGEGMNRVAKGKIGSRGFNPASLNFHTIALVYGDTHRFCEFTPTPEQKDVLINKFMKEQSRRT